MWVTVPIKSFEAAKTRLAGVLDGQARALLARAMAEDVLGTLQVASGIERLIVVTNDEEVAALARELRCEVRVEPPEADISRIMSECWAQLARAGAGELLYLPADVPLVTAEEIAALLAAHRAGGLTLVRAARDAGSNAVAFGTRHAMRFSFGPDSSARHCALAARCGEPARVLELPGIARDIDVPEDLPLLAAASPKLRSARLARSWLSVPQPLPAPELHTAGYGEPLPDLASAIALGESTPLETLMARAARLRDAGRAAVVSYSRKVFIPLTQLCRDVCHYCTFAKTPARLPAPYLSIEQVLAIARVGRAAGCKEALFTLGDRPEARYAAARRALAALGFDSTVAYLRAVAERVLAETGLLPHINAGVLTEEEYRQLRPVAPSMGLMLESASERLCRRGGPHFGSPDKHPAVRLESLRAAGRLRIPMTTGLLIGIGETRAERLASLWALRELHAEHGHLQELILQNFVPKPGTKMHAAPAPPREELWWTVAMARLIFGPGMRIQAPPNLNEGALRELIAAGIDDWGGVSPVTPDHVNPESPWPHLRHLERETAAAGKALTERLTVYPAFVQRRAEWIDPALERAVLRHADAEGFARTDEWQAGASPAPPPRAAAAAGTRSVPDSLERLLGRALAGTELTEAEVERLFAARGGEVDEVVGAADELRRRTVGDTVTYVVNRNINYTNLCTYKCGFCAFSKGRTADHLRGKPYLLDEQEVARRAEEAWARGGTEVCMQGGIHPHFTGETYLALCRAVKAAVPAMHVHAFSPLEVQHGAGTLGLPVERFLERLQAAGLATLPGTAAEILDDPVRALICPDKLKSHEWLGVIEAAHRVGLRTTATIMFGHLETPASWARHLLAVRRLQARTGGFTEFVPLPFVAMEAPLHRRGRTRPGPTWREALLMHAVARLALHPLIPNIQASWVKLGPEGAAACLAAGANDLGGTLMNESISRAAGAVHGQELTAAHMQALAAGGGRPARERTTLYEPVVRSAELRPAV